MDKKKNNLITTTTTTTTIYTAHHRMIYFIIKFFCSFFIPSHPMSSAAQKRRWPTIWPLPAWIARAPTSTPPPVDWLFPCCFIFSLSLSSPKKRRKRTPKKSWTRTNNIYSVVRLYSFIQSSSSFFFWDENAPTKLRFFRIDINTHSSSSGGGGRIFFSYFSSQLFLSFWLV